MHLLTLCTIILTASAHPNLFGRAACNRDDCLRQVVASSHSPGPAKGSADCSSFFKKTLTPCPVTTTVSTTTTPVVTSTATTVVSTTTTTTSVVSATTTSTVTASATVTTSTTVTSTVTVTSIPQQKRAVAACTTVGSPSKIPPYASSCTNVAKYSSACSCDGITMTTTTLAPVTATNTATITAPPSTSVVGTSTSTSTITATETDTVSVTATTTTTTTSTVTQTTTVTATTTVAPFRGYNCNDPAAGAAMGVGGCSSNCYCDQRPGSPSGVGVCDSNTICNPPCAADADCPDGFACGASALLIANCGGPICVELAGCTSSLQKRNPSDAAIDVLAFRDVSPSPDLGRPSRSNPPSV